MVGFTYNASGLVATITYPNGLVVTYTYDDFNRQMIPARLRNAAGTELIGSGEKANRITALQMSLGGSIRTITYSYDAAGKVTGITRPGNVTTDFAYDAAGRMTLERHLKTGASFLEHQLTLDAGGNLQDENVTGTASVVPPIPQAAKATYDKANQIKSWNGAAYTYDEDGNLTGIADGSFAATYSPENRPLTMTRIAGGVATEVTYTYDGDGLRVRRQVTGGETTHYHHGPDGNLLFTTDGSGNITASYVWIGRSLAAILDGPTLVTDLHYTHLDRRGSVVALTDAAGNVEARYASQPYGGTFADVSPGGLESNPFTFIGGLGVTDEGDGLFYMKQRFYDSKTGRFIQRDPLGFSSTSANLYQYAGNNPVNAVDPSGLQFIRLGGERAGDYARDYWAEESVDPNSGMVYHAYATTMGLFASLWTSDTSNYTAGALTLGYGAAAAAGATTPAIVQTTVQGKAIPEIYRLAKITTATHETIITSYESVEGTLRLLGAFSYFGYASYSSSTGGDWGKEITSEEPAPPTPNQEDTDE
jgi:RHS repeat-associated protein